MNNTSVDSYLEDGCGRCANYQTPACKVHTWASVLVALRELLNTTGLEETMKWGMPCYTSNGKNVAMLAAFKDRVTVSFFKGASLTDDDGVLEAAGPNSHVARLVAFHTLKDVAARKRALLRLVDQAITLERSGAKVKAPSVKAALPEELSRRLAKDAKLRRAFEALTPGRQRSHALHIGQAKQAETRERRVDACAPLIVAGRGFHERD